MTWKPDGATGAKDMKKIVLDVDIEILVKDYLELNSSYKVAKKYNTSATAVKRLLKEAGVLRTQKQAAKCRKTGNRKGKKASKETREKLSKIASQRTGEKNPFYGKHHTEETKRKISESVKQRTGKRNPNYKHGKYIRRPRDYKYIELRKLRNQIFTRDNYTCCYCGTKGGHLHAHHKIPYWVRPEAFTDLDNLTTVCSDCHFKKAHNSNWHSFDVTIIDDELMTKYSIHAERLNELASYESKKMRQSELDV